VLEQDENRGPGAARNAGARSAIAAWLVFLDSDDTLTPSALDTFAQSITGRCGLVRAGHVRHRSGELAPLAFLSGTFAVRRDVFERVGGYDPALRYGENSDLSTRLAEPLAALGLTDTIVTAPTMVYRGTGKPRNVDGKHDLQRMRAAIHVLHRDRARLAEHRDERARFEAIASVNATRTEQWDVAIRYAWFATRSEPRRARNYARLALALTGPVGVRLRDAATHRARRST
jgi:GT2 family glycosyltransferase